MTCAGRGWYGLPSLGGRAGMAFRDWGVGLVGLVASPLAFRVGGRFVLGRLSAFQTTVSFAVNSSVEALQYL